MYKRQHLLFPVSQKRLRGGDDDLARGDLNCQNAKACRVGTRHHLGDGGEVDLQRIDVLIVEADSGGQPLAQICLLYTSRCV